MEKAHFLNKTYKVFAILVPSYLLIKNLLTFIKFNLLISLLPISIQIIVLISILLRHKYTKNLIKIYSIILIAGSGLILLSQIIFLFADSSKTDLNKVLSNGIMFICGLILILYVNNFVVITETNSLPNGNKK